MSSLQEHMVEMEWNVIPTMLATFAIASLVSCGSRQWVGGNGTTSTKQKGQKVAVMSLVILGILFSFFGGGELFKTLLEQKYMILLTMTSSLAIDYLYGNSNCNESSVTTHYTVPTGVVHKDKDKDQQQQCLHVHLNEPAKLKIITNRAGISSSSSLINQLGEAAASTVSSLRISPTHTAKDDIVGKILEKGNLFTNLRASWIDYLSLSSLALLGVLNLGLHEKLYPRLIVPKRVPIHQTLSGQIMIFASAVSIGMSAVLGQLYWSERQKNSSRITKMKTKTKTKTSRCAKLTPGPFSRLGNLDSPCPRVVQEWKWYVV